jgi:iron complex transport system ATP-binding protein
MHLAACEPFRHRFIDELSGGERQRVFFAAAIAQQPAALLLDEPGTFVDLPHQIEMFRAIRRLCSRGVLCIAAMHDLNMAAAFATRVVLLHEQTIVADGGVDDVIGGPAFRDVFGEHVQAEHLPSGGVRIHYAL